MKKLLSMVVLAGWAASSQALIVIDNFTTAQSLTVSGTGVVFTDSVVSSGAIGGARRVLGINDQNPNNNLTRINVNSGLANIASGARVDPRVEFGYGVDPVGGHVDMNADLTAGGVNDRIRLVFDSNDSDFQLRLFVRSTTGTGGTTPLAFSRTIAGGRASTAFTEDFLFSSMVGNASTWTDVDQMVFQFDLTEAGDVSLNSMQAVPEPASMLALATGAIALLRRRKRA